MAQKKVYYATGKRKTSIARVYMTKGKGLFTVNKKPMVEYFGRETSSMIINQPLDVVDMHNKFDFNIFGLPKEQYGFSNDAMNLFGAPDFKKALIKLNINKTIKINLR